MANTTTLRLSTIPNSDDEPAIIANGATRNGTTKTHAKPNSKYEVQTSDQGDKGQTSAGRGTIKKGPKYYHDLVSRKIVKGLETIFYRYGKLVSEHPKKVIAICVIVPMLLAIAIVFNFKQNEDFNALLLPKDSRILKELDWLEEQVMREDQRPTRMIIEDENILTSTSLTAMLDLYEGLFVLHLGDVTMESLCVRLDGQCFVESVLSLWRYNRTVIEALTPDTIIDDVNTVEKDPTYFMDFNASRILAAITRNASGHIVAAKVTIMQFLLQSNASTEDTVHDFENLVIDLARRGHKNLQNVFIFTTDVLFDEFFKAVYKDIIFITVGMPLVLLHITSSIGKFNFVEHAILLTGATLLGVMMSVLATFGICLATGLDFGAPHNALVFLLLGIGVDDVFVIMASWEKVNRSDSHLSVEERIGLTMKHAGVSVTVTSVSNFAAFATGILTVAPILSSFGVFSAVGIMILYIIQCSLFPACLTLNQYRIEARRNACCVCYKHDSWKANRCGDIEIVRPFFKKVFAPVILSVPGKIITILATIGFTSITIYGFTQVQQGRDLEKNMPRGNFVRKYLEAQRIYFYEEGPGITVYCDDMDYWTNIDKLEAMVEKYEASDVILYGKVKSWVRPYKKWLQTRASSENVTLHSDGFPDNSSEFYRLLYMFIYSADLGTPFQAFIEFDHSTEPPHVSLAAFPMQILTSEIISDQLGFMKTTRSIADTAGFTDGKCFSHSAFFMFTEVSEYVTDELVRNFILASIAIFIFTSLLIVDMRASLFVMLCVVLTTVDMGGMMYYFDFLIDPNMVMLLTFTVGLSVDFSAHVGYHYMSITGTREQRVRQTLEEIGPAVFHGGFTTFLVFMPLVLAKSFTFYLFFCTFTTVVAFGLFHGLCLLPVLLSLVGPPAYDFKYELTDKIETPNKQDVYDNAAYVGEDTRL